MLFGRRKQLVKRILVVEDEPLTAFENENVLGDAGYVVVATVDDLDEALAILEREEVHLILSDVRLHRQQTGIHLARAAKAPVRVTFDRHEELSVTGYRPAAEMKIALLPSDKGDLNALSFTAYADTGAATNSTLAYSSFEADATPSVVDFDLAGD